jgi:hypothetical protein
VLSPKLRAANPDRKIPLLLSEQLVGLSVTHRLLAHEILIYGCPLSDASDDISLKIIFYSGWQA